MWVLGVEHQTWATGDFIYWAILLALGCNFNYPESLLRALASISFKNHLLSHHRILNGSGLWGFDFEFKTGRIKDFSNDDENTNVYRRYLLCFYCTHSWGQGCKEVWLCCTVSGCLWLCPDNNSFKHIVAKGARWFSFLSWKKKKISSWIRSAVKFGSRQKNQALPSGLNFSAFMKDSILPCFLSNLVNENFLVFFSFQNIIEKHDFSVFLLVTRVTVLFAIESKNLFLTKMLIHQPMDLTLKNLT